MTETAEQMHDRLCAVIAASRFDVLPHAYAWQPIGSASPLPDTALAMVRDDASWYALAPVSVDAAGAYRVLRFISPKARMPPVSWRGSRA